MNKLGKADIFGKHEMPATAPKAGTGRKSSAPKASRATTAGRSKSASPAPDAPGADARSNDAETISLILFRRHLVFLDRYAADCRERGTKATRTAIVRALVEALESGKVDISDELTK